MAVIRTWPLALAVVGLCWQHSRGLRLVADEGRPDVVRRGVVPMDEDAGSEMPMAVDDDLGARKALTAMRPPKSVWWSAEVLEPKTTGAPELTRPGTFEGQEDRLNPDLGRDVVAHRMAEMFVRLPQLLQSPPTIPWPAGSPVSEDALEPLPFHCTALAARKFSDTVAHHLMDFSGAGIAAVANRIGDLRRQCPDRCGCLQSVLGNSSGGDVGKPAAGALCTEEARRKFAGLKGRPGGLLEYVARGCESRCACLAQIHFAMTERQKMQEVAKRFAAAIAQGSVTASCAELDAWARLSFSRGEADVDDFTAAVARELGPITGRATDVVAHWAKSRHGRLPHARIRSICRSLIAEEVHQAFYRCQSTEMGVPCILGSWERPKRHKCTPVMTRLVADALAKLFKAVASDVHGEVVEYCELAGEEAPAEDERGEVIASPAR